MELNQRTWIQHINDSFELRAHISDYELGQFLIQNSHLINTRGVGGHTMLHAMCWRGHFNLVKLLLECGADPNILNHIGNSVLDIAIHLRRSGKEIKSLINAGAKFGKLTDFKVRDIPLCYFPILIRNNLINWDTKMWNFTRIIQRCMENHEFDVVLELLLLGCDPYIYYNSISAFECACSHSIGLLKPLRPEIAFPLRMISRISDLDDALTLLYSIL
jgi:hypothetical protein